MTKNRLLPSLAVALGLASSVATAQTTATQTVVGSQPPTVNLGNLGDKCMYSGVSVLLLNQAIPLPCNATGDLLMALDPLAPAPSFSSAPATGAVTSCTGTTSATPNTPLLLLAGSTALKHLMFQNSSVSASVNFSFNLTTGITATTGFTLLPGQPWLNPSAFIPSGALYVESNVASVTVVCEYD